MPMQIIQGRPSEFSYRQAAFDDSIQRAMQGAAGLVNAYENKQETTRQKALKKLELAQGFASQGIDLKKDELDALNTMVETGEVAPGIQSILNRAASQARGANAYKGKKQQLELAELQGRVDAQNQPFEQSREAQKMAYQKQLENQAAMSGAAVNKEQISEIAKKNAGIFSIKQGIDAALTQLDDPTVPEDLKIKAGQEILKLLNSSEGSDAVGAEEAKRVGSFLEKKFFNLTQPGSMFGRDLKEFTDQVRNNSLRLGDRIKKNEEGIYGLRSGKSLSQIGSTPTGGQDKRFTQVDTGYQGQQTVPPQMPGAIDQAVASPLQSVGDSDLINRRKQLLQKKGVK